MFGSWIHGGIFPSADPRSKHDFSPWTSNNLKVKVDVFTWMCILRSFIFDFFLGVIVGMLLFLVLFLVSILKVVFSHLILLLVINLAFCNEQSSLSDHCFDIVCTYLLSMNKEVSSSSHLSLAVGTKKQLPIVTTNCSCI